MKRPLVWTLALSGIGVILAAALAWQGQAVLGAPPVPSDSLAISIPAGSRIRAEGRVVTYPGGEATIRPEVSGRIVRVHVDEGARVEAGQVLVELAAEEEDAALLEAQARLAEAEAAFRLIEADLARDERLAQSGVISPRNLDRARREMEGAAARRQLAEATIQRLEARLAKSRIVAPLTGTVVARLAEPGETADPRDPLLTVADLEQTRLEVEVDEFDAAGLQIGAPVTIRAEGHAQEWRGRIEEIPDVVSSRRLNPQDPSRPADTRVLIVKVALEEDLPLPLGQRVEVEIGGSR